MPVTIKDVAKKAGVSISTVSRVINNSKPVSPNIRIRVQQVIDETGYVPNPVARSLVMKKSQVIGVIVPSVNEYYIGELLEGVEEVSRIYGYDIVLCNTYGDIEEENDYIDLLISKQVAGFIILTDQIRQEVVKLVNSKNIPCVYFSPSSPNDDSVASVGVDLIQAFEDLLKLMNPKEDDGRILYLMSDEEKLFFEEIFLKSARNMGLKDADYNIIKFASSQKNMYNDIKEVLSDKSSNYTAVLCQSDRIALQCIYILEDLGKKVPTDVRVASIFESDLTNIIRPGLLYIKRPLYDIGAVSARMIVKMIDDIKIEEKNVDLPYDIYFKDLIAKRELIK